LRERDFLLFWAARFVSTLGVQIQSVAMGWQVYAIARLTHSVGESAFMVSMIGLAQFLPLFLLTLIAGETADRRTRKLIMAATLGLDAVSAGVLLGLALLGSHQLWPIFAISVLFGASRAFLSPASSAMGPMLVPRPLLPRAIAWNSLSWQSGSIMGPALGGLLLIHLAGHGLRDLVRPVSWWPPLMALGIRQSTKPETQPGSRVELIKEGLAYVWNNKIVFGSISLDLFAVILGGATALLPVFAKDVLHIGPGGFGLLRAAPAVGATVVAIYLASNPIRRHAGRIMFAGVAVFGAATVVFGLSKLEWLSVGALAVLGGADMLGLCSPDPGADRHPRPHARPRRRRLGRVHQRLQRTGRGRERRAAWLLGPVGAAVFGGVGALVVMGGSRTAAWSGLPVPRSRARPTGWNS
jgi:MFS family permease